MTCRSRGDSSTPKGDRSPGPVCGFPISQVPSNQDFDAYLAKYKLSKDKLWSFDFRSLYISPEVPRETLTDGDGRFRITGLCGDRLADLDRYGPDRGRNAVDGDDPRMPTSCSTAGGRPWGANFTHELRAGRTVSGVVGDRETHEPIPGIAVGNHVRLDWPYQQDGGHPGVTAANGRFTITGIDPEIVPLDSGPCPGPASPTSSRKRPPMGRRMS